MSLYNLNPVRWVVENKKIPYNDSSIPVIVTKSDNTISGTADIYIEGLSGINTLDTSIYKVLSPTGSESRWSKIEPRLETTANSSVYYTGINNDHQKIGFRFDFSDITGSQSGNHYGVNFAINENAGITGYNYTPSIVFKMYDPIDWTGITGSSGSSFVGITGAQGLQGVTGLQGSQGNTGSQGLTGAQGIQGIQGTQGATGIQGIQGTQGNTGVQGIQGTQGATGVQGLQGDTGAQGTTGLINFITNTLPVVSTIKPELLWAIDEEALYAKVTGIEDWVQISAGAQAGATGLQGVTGSAGGPTGLQGPTGSQGLTGAQGNQGIQGNTGVQGIQGIEGETGPAGGPQGVTGISGLKDTYSINGFIETAKNQKYILDQYAVDTYTIDLLAIQSWTGTVTAAIKIDDVDVTSLSAVSVSTVESVVSASGANSVSVGNTVSMTFSSNSNAQNIGFTLKITR